MRVAIINHGISHSVGGGGAGRFFVDVYDGYYSIFGKNAPVKLYFFTDPESWREFRKGGYFTNMESLNRFKFLTRVNNRFKHLAENIDLLFRIVFYRIQLIHIAHYYHEEYYHRIKFLQKLPSFLRPKIVVNFLHCVFPYGYDNAGHPLSKYFHSRFDPMFRDLKIDAVYSWYVLFCEFAKRKRLFRHEPVFYSIRHMCCNTERFYPAPVKENVIVYAARLDEQKNPMMFLEAVRHLKINYTDSIKDWKFMLCGRGPLENEVESYISSAGLSDMIEFRNDVSDMSPIFGKSKCFISTQSYENFTSLSMNEAMASGNAIIARNVGQTDYYVKDGENGYLLKEDTSKGLADAIMQYLDQTDRHQSFQDKSVDLVKNVHSREKFIGEIVSFWKNMISKERK